MTFHHILFLYFPRVAFAVLLTHYLFIFSEPWGHREQVEHVSSLRLCTGRSSFVFSNRFGVCLVDYETAITRTFSLSQFEALRSVKFSGTGESP